MGPAQRTLRSVKSNLKSDLKPFFPLVWTKENLGSIYTISIKRRPSADYMNIPLHLPVPVLSFTGVKTDKRVLQ